MPTFQKNIKLSTESSFTTMIHNHISKNNPTKLITETQIPSNQPCHFKYRGQWLRSSLQNTAKITPEHTTPISPCATPLKHACHPPSSDSPSTHLTWYENSKKNSLKSSKNHHGSQIFCTSHTQPYAKCSKIPACNPTPITALTTISNTLTEPSLRS